jgi:hypothetical protein
MAKHTKGQQRKILNGRTLADKKKAKKAQNKADREAQFPDGIDPTCVRPASTVFSAREFVDWLRLQHEWPVPLITNHEVLYMWFQAANTGISTRQFQLHLDEVMHLWREEGDPESSYTEEIQREVLAAEGPDMRPPVITITWEQFQRERQPASNSATANDLPAAIVATPDLPVPVASDTAVASLVAYYLAPPYSVLH